MRTDPLSLSPFHAATPLKTVLRWAVLLAALMPAVVRAAVIHVPADQPTIQDAVDAAAPGDTVSVAPGDYYEGVKIRGNKAGLTLESADPSNPFVIHGRRYVSLDGVRVDKVDGVTLRNFHVHGAYDGIRLVTTTNAVLIGLHLEDNALHIRVNRGSNNTVVQCTVLSQNGDRGVEQGILVDHSPGTIVAESVVDGAKREGIRVVNSPCVRLVHNQVTNSRGGEGIEVISSPGASIEACTANHNSPDGFLVSNSLDVVFVDNVATDNPGVGIRVDQSRPLQTVADVLAEGNVATGNGRGDVTVRPDNSSRDSVVCPAPTATPKPDPTVTRTPTAIRTPTPIATPTRTFTPRATSTPRLVPTPQSTAPLVTMHWRMYVRIVDGGGGETSVNVPKRSIEPPISAAIRADVVSEFVNGDRMTPAEIAVLGDTLQRLKAAADAYMRVHEADYPDFAAIVEFFWAARIDDGTEAVPTPTRTAVAGRTATATATPNPSRTPTPTATTVSGGSLTEAHWRFYARIDNSGSSAAVNVPKRSTDPAVTALISSDHIGAFVPGVRKTETAIAALGGDTLQRLTAAAGVYMRAHPADYPKFVSVIELQWAIRDE